MGDDRQTYSGWVRTWECDTKEHFTVAYYYYQRFSQATYRLLLEMVGILRSNTFQRVRIVIPVFSKN